jgi:hypothetical protein
MERQPELGQVQRLTVKTVDQVFVARGSESLGCSLFEAPGSDGVGSRKLLSLALSTGSDPGPVNWP